MDHLFKQFLEDLDFKLTLTVEKFKSDLNKRSKVISPVYYSKLPTENYLKSRGYVQTNYNGEAVFIKGFVCVICKENSVIIYHDIFNSEPLILVESVLSHLPIALNYMESRGMSY